VLSLCTIKQYLGDADCSKNRKNTFNVVTNSCLGTGALESDVRIHFRISLHSTYLQAR